MRKTKEPKKNPPSPERFRRRTLIIKGHLQSYFALCSVIFIVVSTMAVWILTTWVFQVHFMDQVGTEAIPDYFSHTNRMMMIILVADIIGVVVFSMLFS